MVPHTSGVSLFRLTRAAGILAGGLLLAVLLLAMLAGLPARVTLGQPQAGLQLDKLGPEVAFAGDGISYTILITNTSDALLEGVIITDTWTKQVFTGVYSFEGVSVLSTVFVTQAGSLNFAQFNLAPMAAGSGGWIRLNMAIPPELQPNYKSTPTTLGNSAVIVTSSPGQTGDSDNVHTAIKGPVLKVSKTYTPTQVRPGRLLTYTFILENLERSDAIDATNVVVTEVLPAKTMFYAAYPPGQAVYHTATRMVEWHLSDSIAVGSAGFVTLTVRVTPTTPYERLLNRKTSWGARADGLPQTVFPALDVSTQVDDVFEKTVRTISPPEQLAGKPASTFPNRLVTYTLTVYNPFTETVTGLVVTESLPSNAVPPEHFRYVRTLAWSPHGPPTVITAAANMVAWRLPAIEAWGVYSLAFEAYVPPHMPIDQDKTQKEYRNNLSGAYQDVVLPTNNGAHDNGMKIYVVPQVVIVKRVQPDKQIYGRPVTYTLSLANNGPTTIHNIVLTDVLPTDAKCAFKWAGLKSGPQPYTTTTNMAAWRGITLTGYTSWSVSFYGTVFGALNARCNNYADGYSPDTFIVRQTKLAPVTVDVPLRFDKEASRASVVLGSTFEYTVQEFNIGSVDMVMDAFTDTLPAGFYAPGYNSRYVDRENMPFTLMAYNANEYATTFPVTATSSPIPCDSLPELVYQNPGTFGVNIVDPPELTGFWVNASKAGSVRLLPQVALDTTTSPGVLAWGHVMTFTLVLSNNTPVEVTHVRLTNTLPSGFTYLGVVPGTPSPLLLMPDIVWTGQVVPAGGKLALSFRTLAPTADDKYTNYAKAVSTLDPLICIPKKKLDIAPGKVDINKTASLLEVDPLGRFTYDLRLVNRVAFTATILRLTDTLPGLSGDRWEFIGVQSGDPPPVSTDPPVWENLSVAPNKTLHLRFTVRVGTQYGTYRNQPPTTPPSVGDGQLTLTLPAGWQPVIPTSFKGAPVTVRPGVGLDKEVTPSLAYTGTTVVYTIRLANQSGKALEAVRITDTLPAGFTFDSMVSGENPALLEPLLWVLPAPLSDGSEKILSFRARIGDVATGWYYNRVEASTKSDVLIPPTDEIAPVYVIGAPSLGLDKSVAPTSTLAGGYVAYTLKLANANDSPITGRIVDTLSDQFSFVDMLSGPPPATVSPPQLVWENIQVPAYTTTTLVFRARVAEGTPAGLYYNRLSGSSTAGLPFPSTGPAAPLRVLPDLDVSVSKSDGLETNSPGGLAVYTIEYANAPNLFDLPAHNVVLTDTFAPADYLTATAPGWNWVSPGVYTRSIGSLAAGSSAWVTFTLHITSALPEDYLAITNSVSIGCDTPGLGESPTSNNVATDIDVVRGPDIKVMSVSRAPAQLRQGEWFTVTATLKNQGFASTGGWFGVDLYVKPAGSPPPAGPGDRYLGICPTPTNYCPDSMRIQQYALVGDGLEPGETVDVTYALPYDLAGDGVLYVQADPYWGEPGGTSSFGTPSHGRVVEGNELNNIWGPLDIQVLSTREVYLPLVLRNR